MPIDAPKTYRPGTYEAEAQGLLGPVRVALTVGEKGELDLRVLSHRETPGVGTRAVDALPAAVRAAGSLDVDAVSGATVTSRAILDAAREALRAASGAAQDEGRTALRAGVYRGRAYGSNGWIELEVKVDESTILDVRVVESHETPLMGTTAIERITHRIVEDQTLAVDAVSGATVTSQAVLEAARQALAEAGARPKDFTRKVLRGAPPAPCRREAFDLVIVGSGAAGLAAAVTAAEADPKLSILVLEKMPVIGGNSLRCASGCNAADPEAQASIPMTETLAAAVERALAVEPADPLEAELLADCRSAWERYRASGSRSLFDCPEWHAVQTHWGGDRKGDVALIRTFADHALEALRWLESEGAPFLPTASQGAGALWQRTHQIAAPAGTGIILPLLDRARALGIDLRTEVRAEMLVQDPVTRRITGLEAMAADGSPFLFESRLGVILASGGYSQNRAMRAASSPALTADMVSTNQPGATGDGILLAEAVGAAVTGMEYVQVYPLAAPGSGAIQGRARRMSGLDDVIDVNCRGERFVNEDARRDDFVAAILRQPGGMCWDVNDSSIVEPVNGSGEDIETLVQLGRIRRADTLAELARKIGVPADALERTVAEFNRMVKAGRDPVFGRQLFDRPIEKPPFYAVARAPSIHHTMGGLKINPRAEVLDGEGRPIPGLFAAGEVAGGIHGSNRLGGNAITDCLVFGRIAARTAMAG